MVKCRSHPQQGNFSLQQTETITENHSQMQGSEAQSKLITSVTQLLL